jgi:hypothetical protein
MENNVLVEGTSVRSIARRLARAVSKGELRQAATNRCVQTGCTCGTSAIDDCSVNN